MAPSLVMYSIVPVGHLPSQGIGVTLTVLLLAFEGEAWTKVMLAPPKPLPAKTAASIQTS